ncbi:preprotein translocase subunit YajC [Halomonas piscis]|uniref:Preprotein translocase subunit YajC n=1 Tax=Halomonas piscis TaxID=3031727 RepID=A0ABY9YYP8_9GAMM|nr:preprotein translocase subunit YajC [Halomonas piscis]WNK19204.1 preprotein translocase subunit YajC [Halomonas piscis]
MQWLIVVAAILMVVSPVMWLKPSPRQRRQSRLREMARQRGVEIAHREAPLHRVKDKMPAYRLRYPDEHPGPDFVLVRDSVASAELDRYCPGWRFRIAPLRPLPASARQALEALIAKLPEDVLVVQSSAAALTLWWWESATAESFAPCVKEAAALRDALSGYADRPEARPPAVPGTRPRSRH